MAAVARARFAGAAPALLRATAPALLRVPGRRIGAAAPANSLHSLARLPRAPPPLAARCRLLCSTADAISKFTDDFTEAQLLLGDAEEVVGTTYFEEDLAEAKELTESVVKQFDDLLAAAPTAEEKATAELAAKKRKAEAEVKATLEKAKEDAEAATGGIDWKAMRVVDDDEEAFYGTYDREKMKPKEYKYLDESAPMYESIEEADAAFEAAQKQKEADEKERAAEAAAGREAKTRAEKIAEEGDGHWHSKRGRGGVPLAEALRAKHLDTEVGAIGMRPLRHHIHFDDEPLPSPAARGSEADAKTLDVAVGAVGARPARRGADRAATTTTKKPQKVSRAGVSPEDARAGVISVVDKDGYECSIEPVERNTGKAKLGAFETEAEASVVRRFGVFDELRAKDEARRFAALGAPWRGYRKRPR